uniref:glutamine--tRNA ligase n=1 Tax=Neobodo designis TaxID=312471 RepID=A0A7S1Q8A8_NEODS|mmetsp:Transcript_34079/g.105274  ORF Transcript_34079/g.105274 Transcript_34079/m.105274 type:complete len:549 (+) Transcript_34079:74-1720(+)|eukprot:CAMPEP_0174854214 /NCGR_PEP_ID=MMETSP1114-20130205/30388_1 /TAXON_ID=312471 /ORGANISM="Neobodo designis, Strain CCAP 1951/1" /LENGTH=548 /DNA_ID=CAMNT_0016088897 /DNA_START=76 /DNA_END=1722 /DNA_ORIENTATION=+
MADQPRDLKHLETGRPVPGYSNTAELAAQHKAITGGKPHFRFPPEPNGYLHIGHAKSMNLNFGEAKKHGGFCYLRYDDTNPESEEEEYIKAIEEMARWMGWSPDKITYSSDYFEQLYAFAIQLIKDGKAYVDHSTPEMLRKQREERSESPWRNRGVEENLRLFEHMRQGRYAEGEATLRCKIDMQHNNPNMRDFIAYRVKYTAHPHVGSKWCIYPSYDYTHCLVDSLEHVDYSLCTLEFEIRRESYFWLLDALNIYRPHVWEFSRLNVTGALLSKRKINALVQAKIVRGFDDPRLLTLAGMRRRGYTPAAINHFCDLVGITRSQNVIELRKLEQCVREDLDEKCERRLAVIDPIKVVVVNWEGSNTVEAPNHPRDEARGKRMMTFSNNIWIDQSDFRLEDDKKYFGLAPSDKWVGLKYSGIVKYVAHTVDDKTGKVTEVKVEIDFERKVKPKTNISWVNAADAVPVEVRQYTPLLTDDKAAIEPDFMQYIDENSEHVSHGYIEAAAASMKLRDSVQYERFGFFTVDDDTKDGRLVMNRIVSLKEDKAK